LICAGLYSGRTTIIKCKNCDKKFTKKTSALKYGYGKFCSKECHNKSMEIHFKINCPQCGNEFETGNNVVDKRKYCSKECMKLAYRLPIEKQLLLDMYIEQELTSREIGEVIQRDKKVVIDYLRYYEIKVRPDGFKNRERIKCKDGHMVRSYYERAFDNYLYKEGIEHEYDYRLPFEKRSMCDFKVQDVYIEIWGMMSWEKYRDGRNRKLKLYQENNCKLLEIFPEDFKDLKIKLEELKRLIS